VLLKIPKWNTVVYVPHELKDRLTFVEKVVELGVDVETARQLIELVDLMNVVPLNWLKNVVMYTVPRERREQVWKLFEDLVLKPLQVNQVYTQHGEFLITSKVYDVVRRSTDPLTLNVVVDTFAEMLTYPLSVNAPVEHAERIVITLNQVLDNVRKNVDVRSVIDKCEDKSYAVYILSVLEGRGIVKMLNSGEIVDVDVEMLEKIRRLVSKIWSRV